MEARRGIEDSPPEPFERVVWSRLRPKEEERQGMLNGDKKTLIKSGGLTPFTLREEGKRPKVTSPGRESTAKGGPLTVWFASGFVHPSLG